MDMKLQKRQASQGTPAPRPDLTGIPRQMKLKFEAASGTSFDDVRIHYNSDRPAAVGALAYTQGAHVYLKPGQERHLPHELGHVIQQKRGLVRPTAWVNGFAVNDDPRLEREADAWAAAPAPALSAGQPLQRRAAVFGGAIQRADEEKAIAATIRPRPTRRGNRRGSVERTRGYSAYYLGSFRRWFKRHFWPSFCNRFHPPRPSLGLYLLVYGEAARAARAANCGEFAAITYAHLAQHTRGQYVYYCHMCDPRDRGDQRRFDHAFTITSPQRFPTNRTLPADADLDSTMIVDGWDNYRIATLGQFCRGYNPYQESLTPHQNVFIDSGTRATPENELPRSVRRYISQETQRYLLSLRLLRPAEQTEIMGRAGYFDFRRSSPRRVTDLRVSIPAYLRDRAGPAERHAELDQMTMTELTRTLNRLTRPQRFLYLQYLRDHRQWLRFYRIRYNIHTRDWAEDMVRILTPTAERPSRRESERGI